MAKTEAASEPLPATTEERHFVKTAEDVTFSRLAGIWGHQKFPDNQRNIDFLGYAQMREQISTKE